MAAGHRPWTLECSEPTEFAPRLDIALERQARLRGVVLADGEPVSGAQVWAESEGETRVRRSRTARAEAPGVFDIALDEPRRIRLHASHERYASIAGPWFDYAGSGFDGLELDFGATGSMRGRVRSLIPGAERPRVHLHSGRSAGLTLPVRSDGTFESGSLSSGD